MEATIKREKTRKYQENLDSRQNVGNGTKKNNQTISNFRSTDLYNKQSNAATMYSHRKNTEVKRKYDRQKYNESIQRANHAMAADHLNRQTMHDIKLLQLNEIEERLIGELQTTIQRKNATMDILSRKSAALKKNLEPRQAYRQKTPKGSVKGGVREYEKYLMSHKRESR